MKKFFFLVLPLFFLSGLYGQGNTCADPYTINALPYASPAGLFGQHTTCGAEDDYDSNDACNSTFLNGEETVYSYTPTAANNACVEFELSTSNPIAFFVFDGCPSAVTTSCIGQGSDNRNGTNKILSGTYNLTIGTEYFFVVSSSIECGFYDVTLNAGNCTVGSGTSCQNAILINSLPFNPTQLYNNCTGADNYNAGNACGGWLAGEDIVFKYTPKQRECIDFFLDKFVVDPVAPNRIPGFSLIENCPTSANARCLYSNAVQRFGANSGVGTDDFSNRNFDQDIYLNANQDYYFIISRDNGCTDFEITITGNSLPLGADCNNPIPVNSFPYLEPRASTRCMFPDYGATNTCNSNFADGNDIIYAIEAKAGQCLNFLANRVIGETSMVLTDACPNSGAANCLASDECSLFFPDKLCQQVGFNYTIPTDGTYYLKLSARDEFTNSYFELEITETNIEEIGKSCVEPYLISSFPFFGEDYSTSCKDNDFQSANTCAPGFINGDDVVFELDIAETGCYQFELEGLTVRGGAVLFDKCPADATAQCLVMDNCGGENCMLEMVYTFTNTGKYYLLVSAARPSEVQKFDLKIEPFTDNKGDNCSNAYSVSTFPFKEKGFTTVCKTNDYTTNCGGFNNTGNDYVFEVNVNAPGCYSFDALNLSKRGGMYLFDDCPDAAGANCLSSVNCVPAQFVDNCGVINITYTFANAGTYYIVVKARNGNNDINFDFSANRSASDIVGLDCNTPLAVNTFPFSAENLSTACKNNDFTDANACGNDKANGNDYYITIDGKAGECLSATIKNLVRGGVFLTDLCPTNPAAQCLAQTECEGGISCDSIKIEYTFLNDGVYYLTVSASDLDRNQNFGLNITKAVPVDKSCDECEGIAECADCPNAGFENGNLNGWTGTFGRVNPDAFNPGFNQGVNNSTFNQHTIVNAGGYDSVAASMGLTLPVVSENGGDYALRLGNSQRQGGTESMTYNFTVTPQNELFTYYFAVVFEDGGHGAGTSPFLDIQMKDGNGDEIECAAYHEFARDLPDFYTAPNSNVRFKNWTPISIPLTPFLGQNVSITFTTQDCFVLAHYGYAYVDAVCDSFLIRQPENQIVCGSGAAILEAPIGFDLYNWSNGATTRVISVTEPGTYTCTMTTFTGCVVDVSAVVENNNPLANFTASDVCFGNDVNFSEASTSSLASPINSWLWDFGDGTPTSTNQNPNHSYTTAGTYNVKLTVSTDNGCSDDTTIAVTVFPETIVTVSPTQANICEGDSILLTASGASSYTWSPSGSLSSSTDAMVYAKPSSTTSYTVSGEASNGCSADATVDIRVDPEIDVTVTPDTTICEGALLTLMANGASTYVWSPSSGLSSTTISNPDANPNASTLYKVVGSSGSCTDSAEVMVNISPLPQSVDFTTTLSACSAPDGIITINNVNGVNSPFTYSLDDVTFQTSNVFNGLDQGAYSLYIKDNKGCTLDTVFTINTVNGPTAIDETVVNSTCSASDGSITVDNVTGGVSPYEYSIDGTSFQSSNVFGGITQGNYTVTVRDANGCTFSKMLDVLSDSGIDGLTATLNDENCDNAMGSILNVTALGGTAPYTFSIDGLNFSNDSDFTNLSAGTYTLSIRDENNCQFDSILVISNTPAPNLSVTSTNASCNGASDATATVLVTGGNGTIIYLWNTIPQQTTATATNLSAGMYRCYVNDNNCMDSIDVIISEPTAIVLNTSSTQSSCGAATGTATVTASGGSGSYTYSWNTTPVQTTATANNLASGSYTVTVFDDNNCSQTATVNVATQNGPQITLDSLENITCNSGSDGAIYTTTTGGSAPYSYSWNTTPIQNNDDATALTTGSYTLSVTDASGCATSLNQTLSEPFPITATFSTLDEACNQVDGSITTTASGGIAPLSYSWNTTPVQNTANINNLAAGNYTLTITDANNCSANFNTSIGFLTGPSVNQASFNNVNCQGGNDGSISLSATGNSSLSYTWNTTPVQTTANISNLSEGSYTCRIQDARGCFVDTTFIIGFNNQAPVFSLGSNQNFCQGDSVQIGTNDAADAYLWNTGETSNFIYAKSAGNYTLTITRNGCSFSDNIDVFQDSPPVVDLGNDSTFCGQVNISHDVTVSGSATYLWDDGSTSPTRNITQTGVFWAEISRGTCTVRDSVEYFIQPELMLSLPSDQTLCQGQSYTIVPSLANQQNPSYTWSNGATTPNITVTQSGTYTLSVSDGVCVVSESINVIFNAQPTVNLGNDTSLCVGDTLILNVGSANASYTKTWSTGESSNSILVTSNGTYSVNVQNQNCSASDAIDVNFIPAPVFTLAPDTTICRESSINIGINPFNNNSYLWNTGQTSSKINVSTAGSYTLTVFDGVCSSSETQVIDEFPRPRINFFDTILCKYDTLMVDISCAGCSYLWEDGSTSPMQVITAPDQKEILLTDSNGCVNSRVITINLDQSEFCDPPIYVPNTFTPNGDGINETFFPVVNTELLEDYHISIYNRWGELIFESSNPNEAWDGFYKGTLSQIGVYNWIIQYQLIDDVEIKQIFGKVNVVK